MDYYNVWIFTLLASITQPFVTTAKSYDGKTEIVVPFRVNENDDFITYKIPCPFPRNLDVKSIKKKQNLHYKVKIKGEDLHIELMPNIGIIPRSRNVQQEKYEASAESRNHSQQFSYPQCQYHGHVRGKPSKVVVSNCAGLMGYIQVNGETFMIEPMERVNSSSMGQPHLVYEYNVSPKIHQRDSTSTNERWRRSRIQAKRDKNHDWYRGADPGYMKQMYLETLVVLDKTLIDFHQSLDLDNYIHTVLNMAHTLFRDSSFGAPLELVLVRMISLDKEDDEMNIGITKDGPKVLEVFKAWANRMNPLDDHHPYHHDVAILITRVDICLRGEAAGACGLVGLASLASVCDAEEQAILVEDNGLVLGFTIAHELGHALGMEHDGLDESGCEVGSPGGPDVVMTKQVSLHIRNWSRCSREYLWAYIDAGLSSCLYDEPADQQRAAELVLPGAAYGVPFQCRSFIDQAADACPDIGVECDNLKCWIPKYGCLATGRPLAEGTACGEGAWCFSGRCLTAGQRPGARDGGWSAWGGWSDCSRTCGGGVRRAARSCDLPPPAGGGSYCTGQRVRYQLCNVQACPFNAESHRDVQCAEFNSWLYPEDNQTHIWKSYITTSEKPCALVCANERRELVVLRAVAADGTPCYTGHGHVCVAGQCKSVGCDGQLDSEAVEDACGVCRGGGISCSLQAGELTIKKNAKLQLVLAVPVKTQFAVFEETSPTKGRFVVRSGKTTIVSGNKFGTSNFKNMKIWMGFLRHQQELLRITGPVTEVLHVYMEASEQVTVKYSVGRASEQRAGLYSWQHIGWSECSAPCGPGVHSSLAKCVEATNGVVDIMHCPENEKPKPLTRVCEMRKCEPRWQVGEWSGCDCTCADDIDERAVNCVRSGGGEGGSDSAPGDVHVVRDSLCLPPKPISQRPCKCPQFVRAQRTLKNGNVPSKLRKTYESVKGHFRKATDAKPRTMIKNKISESSLTKIINKDHLKNIKSIQQMRGHLIQDYDSINDFVLTLEKGDPSSDKNVAEFKKLHKGDSKASVHGVEAVKIIKKIQESHHFTTPK